MRKQFAYACFLFAAIYLAAGTAKAVVLPHDFHVSVTQITYNTQTQALEITVKIFAEDLERSVLALGGGDLRLGDPREATHADDAILGYLRNRLSVKVNEQAMPYSWVGKEVEIDALWCYLEIKDILHLTSLEITNRILTEIFEDQANVVHIEAYAQKKSLFLSKSMLSERISF
jgi:hypothetical protein